MNAGGVAAEAASAAEGPDVDAALATLAKGSLTFSFAGWFLPADRRRDAAVLYSFCRHVDDLADDAPNVDEARRALAQVRAELDGERPARPIVAALVELAHRRGVDLDAARCLIDTALSDQGLVRLPDDAALVRYAYGVAGTVGLMMCGVLGVTDAAARAHAIDLGVAMQLTNICRDVAEDARLGRVYLPADRLAAAGGGVEPEAVLASRAAVSAVVLDLLDLADRYYTSAEHGLRFIPWRARLAICVAARVYRAIGVRSRAIGGDALAGRVVVPLTGKLWHMGGALWAWARTPWWRAPHDARLHVALVGLPGAHVAPVGG